MIDPETSIRIYWSYSHDCGDDNIQSQLKAGSDEGPLIVLSGERSNGPRRVGPIGIFRNVTLYLASLIGEEPNIRERWVGLVRGSNNTNGQAALAALQRIERSLTPVRKFQSVGNSFGRGKPLSKPYGAVVEPVDIEGAFTIINHGEGFDDVRRAYPYLLPTMKI